MNMVRVCVLLGSSLIIVACSLIIFSAAKFHYDLAHETPEEQSRHDVFLEVAIFFSYIMLGISSFYILLTILLIVGVVKKNHKIIIPWFFCTVCGMILECILLLIGFNQLVGFLILQLSVCILLFWINDDKHDEGRNGPEHAGLNNLETNKPNCGLNAGQYV